MKSETLLSSIQKSVAESDKNRDALLAFAENYPIDIPAHLIFCHWSRYGANLDINAGRAPDENGRNKLLAFIGKAWGSQGWMRIDPGHGGGFFDWTKKIDGVDIKISRVEAIPTYHAPVPPSVFPLMLPEYSDAEPVEV